MQKQASFRFYAELNDFLPPERQKCLFLYSFKDNPSIKDTVEAIGVPHTEVDLILVNGKSVTFSYILQNDDIVSVYPVFEGLDISEVTHLRAKSLREPKFIVDVHLGKLAKYLRILGFDVLYRNNYEAAEIIKIAKNETRIILTKSVALLKNKLVTRGYWIRSKNLFEQLKEVLLRFDLFVRIKPFSRCLVCNGVIKPITKKSIINGLLPDTKLYFEKFYQCDSCNKIYWQGSHYYHMQNVVNELIKDE